MHGSRYMTAILQGGGLRTRLECVGHVTLAAVLTVCVESHLRGTISFNRKGETS